MSGGRHFFSFYALAFTPPPFFFFLSFLPTTMINAMPVPKPPNAPPSKAGRMLPLLVDRKGVASNTALLRSERRYADDGYLQLVERHQIPSSLDLESDFIGPNAPLQLVSASIHPFKKKYSIPHKVMTECSGYTALSHFKLDFGEIERIPARMNVSELKRWEIEEQIATLEDHPTSSSDSDTSSRREEEHVRDDPRTYAQLLDLYSMHEITIRNGKTLRNTPEFASFKRFNSGSWGAIESLLQTLEEFLKSYGVDLAYVNGRKVALIASYQPEGSHLTREQDLLACIANREDVEPLLGDYHQLFFYGTTGHHLAASTIQSAWRMYRQRIAYVHLLLGTRAATVIQRQWAVHRAHLTTKRTIKTVKETRLLRWRQTMADFVEKWPRIRESRRLIIHIPSLSFPSFHVKRIPFYFTRQIGQLMRICDLSDPLVEIIFIAPFKPDAEIKDYYISLLEEAGISNVSGRFTLLVPEDVKRLPEGMSLTRLTVLSTRLMKALKALAAGRVSYIVPGVIGAEELTLATLLNLPLLAPEPRIAQVFGIKSGAHRLLESSEVNTAPGAMKLRSRADLLHALAQLLVQHRDISRWLVKIETEANSRGHAYFDAGGIKALKDVDSGSSADEAGLLLAVLHELEDYGAKRVRLVDPACYPDWMTYLTMVDKVGACIVGVPSKIITNITANLFIEPSGVLHLESVLEPLQAPAFTTVGTCYPCSTPLPYEAIRDAALNVARAAFRKRVIGYLSVDFVLFLKEPSAISSRTKGEAAGGGEPLVRMWGVDVDLGLSHHAAVHKMVMTLTKTVWDSVSGDCWDSESQERKPLSYVYSGIIYNPYMSSIRHEQFFSLCRSKGITFDRRRSRGVIFHMLDVMLCGCLGAIAVGTDLPMAVRRIAEFQSLLNFELPKQGEHAAESNFVYFSSVVRQLTRILKKVNHSP